VLAQDTRMFRRVFGQTCCMSCMWTRETLGRLCGGALARRCTTVIVFTDQKRWQDGWQYRLFKLKNNEHRSSHMRLISWTLPASRDIGQEQGKPVGADNV